MSGHKADNGKPKISLIPSVAIKETAKAFTFGADKYGQHNYRKGIAYTRLIDAAMRHILAFADGENNDPESGNSHLGHASANLAMLMDMFERRKDLDDRWSKENNTNKPVVLPNVKDLSQTISFSDEDDGTNNAAGS